MRKEGDGIGRFEDLTGRKFGRLTVIKRVEDYVSPKGQHHTQWLCKCECGGECIVRGSYLKNKNTRSCGCLDSETTAQRNREYCKKYNKYDLTKEYGIGYTSKGEEFWFDLEDYDKIKDFCWYLDAYGYVVSCYSGTKNSRKGVKMHRLLLPEFEQIDHINNKKNDNRKINLRKVTDSQNNMNRKLRSNNTSGVTGVYWDKSSQKWFAQIVANKEKKFLGYFNDFNDAVTARKDAEEKYFGEFSYDNSMKVGEKYGNLSHIS